MGSEYTLDFKDTLVMVDTASRNVSLHFSTKEYDSVSLTEGDSHVYRGRGRHRDFSTSYSRIKDISGSSLHLSHTDS
jgi:hypothetical protein